MNRQRRMLLVLLVTIAIFSTNSASIVGARSRTSCKPRSDYERGLAAGRAEGSREVAKWVVIAQEQHEAGYTFGLKVGAKIAMQGDYRLEEVRASCDDDELFRADECVRCHN